MDLLPSIDAKAIAEELQVSQQGLLSGLNNAPPPDASAPDETEKKIEAKLSDLCAHGRSQAADTLTAMHNRQNGIDLSAMVDAITATKAETEINIDRLKAEEHDRVLSLRREERKLWRAFQYFKSTNQITHEPHYPDSTIFHWSILAAMVVGETVANGYFFSKGNDLGLLGGVFQALLISLANVGLAVLVGAHVMRHLNHVSIVKRVLAGVGMVVWVAIAGIFNLAIAHYRYLLEIDPAGAMSKAMSHMLSKGFFAIDNVEAWVLFVIGLVCSIFALLKSYFADDRYPGYGQEHRRYAEAKRAYTEQKQRLRNRIAAIVDQGRAELDKLVERGRQGCNDYRSLVAQIKGLEQDNAAFERAIDAAFHSLLKQYREANEKVRSSDSPAYFKTYHSLCGHVPLNVLPPEAYQGRAAELDKDMLRLTEAAKAGQGEFKAINERAIATVEAFFDSIEKEADRQSAEEAVLAAKVKV